MRVFSKIFLYKRIVGRQKFVQYIRMLYLGFIDLNRTVYPPETNLSIKVCKLLANSKAALKQSKQK